MVFIKKQFKVMAGEILRPYAINTGSTISGTTQVGDIAIGENGTYDYSTRPGGVTWYMGPDENLGYLIVHPDYENNRPRFKRTSGFNDDLFLIKANEVASIMGHESFTDVTDAVNWMNLSGVSTTFGEVVNNIPFFSDLSGYITGRTGTNMSAILGSDAEILPACGYFAGSEGGNYGHVSVSNWAGTDSQGFIETRFYFMGSNVYHYILSSGDENYSSRYFRFGIANKKLELHVRCGATSVHNVIRGQTELSVGWNTIRVGSNGSVYSMFINGQEESFIAATGVNDGAWANKSGSGTFLRDNVTIGVCLLNSLVTTNSPMYIDYVNYNNTNKWIVTGIGNHIYDVIGGLHMDWINGSDVAYDLGASTGLLDNGYSVWTSVGKSDEIVPYYSGQSIDVSSFLVDYVKSHDCVGVLTGHNLAPSLINIPGVNFNRSNVTIFNDAARNGDDYSTTNPNRWRPQDIADPRIYYEWRNVGFKGMIGIKVNHENNKFYAIYDILLYSTDKRGNDQYSVMQYCENDDFALWSGGELVLDENNYIVFV